MAVAAVLFLLPCIRRDLPVAGPSGVFLIFECLHDTLDSDCKLDKIFDDKER